MARERRRSFLLAACCAVAACPGPASAARVAGTQNGSSSSSSAAARAVKCIGSDQSSGTCAVLLVPGIPGMLRQDCYKDPSSGDIASRGEPGECYLPFESHCGGTWTCRPGMRCSKAHNHADAGEMPRCVGPSRWPTPEGASGASQVARMVRGMARFARKEVEERGFSTVRCVFANTPLEEGVLHQVYKSFKTASSVSHDETSKSNAKFVYSGDRLFIAKKIRDYEYKDLTAYLFGKLGRHAKLARAASCTESESSDAARRCWATAALQHTLLSLPVMAFNFKDEGDWVVIPYFPKLRAYAMTGSLSAMPMGAPWDYDVKPQPSSSNQRGRLVRALAEIDFAPDSAALSGPAAAAARDQWLWIVKTLSRDTRLLEGYTGFGGEQKPFVDYSLLFEIYRPKERITDPGPGCVSSRPCFEEGSKKPCTVVCVGVIDYFLRHDSFWTGLESYVISDKWEAYRRKTLDMVDCLGDLARNRVERSRETAEGEVFSVRRPPKAMWADNATGPVRAQLVPGRLMAYFMAGEEGGSGGEPASPSVVRLNGMIEFEASDPCAEYSKEVCEDRFSEVVAYSKKEDFVCSFNIAGGRAKACRPRLLQACAAALRSERNKERRASHIGGLFGDCCGGGHNDMRP